ncbi:Nn.00g114560.m01.CDS01 [Neocucurbitaria sp. VM-36]
MTHNILLIGGAGKVSQLLTPLLLARSWNVTSVIRKAEQKAAIEKLGQGQPGKLSVLVSSVADVKSEADAKKVLDQVKPDWVVWSAGAGGKGGAEMTFVVDRDAASYFTKASIHTPSIKKFLTVSYLSSRRGRPSWWTDKDWESAQKVNNEVLPDYYKAKVIADEVLTVFSQERNAKEAKDSVPVQERFCGISLRPGTLTDEKAGGVRVGKIGVGGKTSRATVAEAIVAALQTEGAKGWIDIIDGDNDVSTAIEQLTREGVDSVDEEDLETMKENIAKL